MEVVKPDPDDPCKVRVSSFSDSKEREEMRDLIHEELLKMGVDMAKPKEIGEDMRFLRCIRLRIERAANIIWDVGIKGATTAVLGYLGYKLFGGDK